MKLKVQFNTLKNKTHHTEPDGKTKSKKQNLILINHSK